MTAGISTCRTLSPLPTTSSWASPLSRGMSGFQPFQPRFHRSEDTITWNRSLPVGLHNSGRAAAHSKWRYGGRLRFSRGRGSGFLLMAAGAPGPYLSLCHRRHPSPEAAPPPFGDQGAATPRRGAPSFFAAYRSPLLSGRHSDHQIRRVVGRSLAMQMLRLRTTTVRDFTGRGSPVFLWTRFSVEPTRAPHHGRPIFFFPLSCLSVVAMCGLLMAGSCPPVMRFGK
jgi:hypothetical protein